MLHCYTCIFRWFNLLVYHLNCGKLKWSPTSTDIHQYMISVRNLGQGKTGLKVTNRILQVEQLLLVALRGEHFQTSLSS